jgi:hypothetical protein
MAFLYLRLAGCVAGVAWLLSGCQQRNQEPCLLVNSEFESDQGWETPLAPFLSTDQAHSGKYSYRLGQGAEYSSNYIVKLSQCGFMPRRLRVSAWVYLPNGRIRSTFLVTQVLCHGRRPDVWEGLEIASKVKRYQVWESIQKYIRLPDDLQPSDELKVYIWHTDPSGENIWFDDIQVKGKL